MTTVLESLDQLTTGWLSESLRASCMITRGSVATWTSRANPAFNSQVAHLDLAYSADSEGSAPPRVLLKICHRDAGRGEVEFYQALTGERALPMLVPCHHSAHSAVTGTSNLLLEDLSETHAAPVELGRVLALDAVPAEVLLDQIADAIGGFHAHWWEHALLGQRDFTLVRPWFRDQEHYRRHLERRHREWGAFAAKVGHELPAEVRGMYERVLPAMPRLWRRYLSDRVLGRENITLSHGDCYFGQFLCPRDPARARTRLIDFGAVSANFAPYDLVYLCCTFWTSEQRLHLGRERRFLERYHRALVAGGVARYPWQQLQEDYRLMVLFMIFDPVWNQTDGSPRTYWWPKLRCLAEAYRDLDCDSLLRE